MALHRLTSITIGVPNVAETAAYYDEFGLTPDGDGWLRTRDGGRQLRIVFAPTRRLVDLRVGVDDQDDLARAANNLTRLGVEVHGEVQDRGYGLVVIMAVPGADDIMLYEPKHPLAYSL